MRRSRPAARRDVAAVVDAGAVEPARLPRRTWPRDGRERPARADRRAPRPALP
ncbi:hypothetical protein WMF31_39175 [Sorangium sp. So ce1036]|uniref:hypothetical protein n=1 Tax=Sorangium sp. So ce1036 TaxID=3133328 RepID=UPI003F047DE5